MSIRSHPESIQNVSKSIQIHIKSIQSDQNLPKSIQNPSKIHIKSIQIHPWFHLELTVTSASKVSRRRDSTADPMLPFPPKERIWSKKMSVGGVKHLLIKIYGREWQNNVLRPKCEGSFTWYRFVSSALELLVHDDEMMRNAKRLDIASCFPPCPNSTGSNFSL